MENLRRVVTGHNTEGKSIIMIDGGPSRSIGENIGGAVKGGRGRKWTNVGPTPRTP